MCISCFQSTSICNCWCDLFLAVGIAVTPEQPPQAHFSSAHCHVKQRPDRKQNVCTVLWGFLLSWNKTKTDFYKRWFLSLLSSSLASSLSQRRLIWPCSVTVLVLLGKIKRVFVDVLRLCSCFIKITDCLVSVEFMYVLLMYINVLHLSALTNLMNKLLHFLIF